MTPENRRSLRDAVPPQKMTPFYDANQLLVHRAICRGCGVEYCVPLTTRRDDYVCQRCNGAS